MSQKVTSRLRLSCAAGLGLALMGLASLPAAAQQAAPAPSNDNLTVVRDAETGKLRAPTAAEAETLRQSGKVNAMRKAPQATLQKFNANGAAGVRLTDEMISASVVVRKPDGSLESQCFDSHGAADSAAAAGHVHTLTPVTE